MCGTANVLCREVEGKEVNRRKMGILRSVLAKYAGETGGLR